MEIDPLETLKASHSSDMGMSVFETIAKCPAYFALRKLEKKLEAIQEQPDDAPEETLATNWHSNVGVLFHLLMELYYGDRWTQTVFKFSGDREIPEWEEACRLFRAYRKVFPSDEFSVRSVEEDFVVENSKEFGVPRLTGRFDLTCHIGSGETQAFLERRGHVISSGTYLLDHKVKWRRNGVAEKEWAFHKQFWAYMMAWNILHPTEPIQGMIVNVVYAYKEQKRDPTKGGPKFETFAIPFPDSQKQAIVRAFLQQGHETLKSMQFPANTTNCFRFSGRVCEFHPSAGGPCNLIGYDESPRE